MRRAIRRIGHAHTQARARLENRDFHSALCALLQALQQEDRGGAAATDHELERAGEVWLHGRAHICFFDPCSLGAGGYKVGNGPLQCGQSATREAETTAQPRHSFALAVGVAVDDAPDALSRDVRGDGALHFDEDEAPLTAIVTVQAQHRLRGRAGAGEGVDDQRVLVGVQGHQPAQRGRPASACRRPCGRGCPSARGWHRR